MEKKTIMLIMTSAIVGCIIINTLALGAYHWVRVYQDWDAPQVLDPKKIDLGHEPAELAMDMEYDTLKQMEKAIKEELKYRDKK